MPFLEFCEGGKSQGQRTNELGWVPIGGGWSRGGMWSGKMASVSPRACPPVLPHIHPLLFVPWHHLIAATPYCRLHGTLFFSAGQPSYPHRTLPALLSALPWVPGHGLGWNPNYWDHKIEHGTYGTHGIGAYGIYVVVCLCGVLLSCECLRHGKKIRLLRIKQKQSDVRFSYMNENEKRSDQWRKHSQDRSTSHKNITTEVPYAPRGSRTTRLPSLCLFRSLPPPFVRPPVLHFAATPSRSLSLPPDTFKSAPPATFIAVL